MNLGNKIKYTLLSILLGASSFAMQREERIIGPISNPIIRSEKDIHGVITIKFTQVAGNDSVEISQRRAPGAAPQYAGVTIENGVRKYIRGEDARRAFEYFSLRYQQQQNQQ